MPRLWEAQEGSYSVSVLHGRYVTMSRIGNNGSKLITNQRFSKDGRKLRKHRKHSKGLDEIDFLA